MPDPTDFEIYCRAAFRRRFPARLRWTVEEQHSPPKLNVRFDFYAYRGAKRAVYDAKWKKSITHADVDKLLEDAAHVRARHLGFFLASGTVIPMAVRERIDDAGIELVWMRSWDA